MFEIGQINESYFMWSLAGQNWEKNVKRISKTKKLLKKHLIIISYHFNLENLQ